MPLKNIKKSLLLSLLSLGALSCGSEEAKDKVAKTTHWIENAFAEGFAVASPMAQEGQASASAMGTKLQPMNLEGDESIDEKAERFEQIASTASSCGFELPQLGNLGQTADCYGPEVTYNNHPDGSPTSGTLPSGDLGLWQAEEASTGEACAAAQINQLMKSASAYIDAALLLQSSAICVLDSNGRDFPETVGDSLNFTGAFDGLVEQSSQAATLTEAVVTVEENELLDFNFKGTSDGAREFDVHVRIKKTSDSSYEGRIYGYFTPRDKDAFTVIFKREADQLQARMLAGTYPEATSSSSLFDSDLNLKLDNSLWSGNMNQAVLDFDIVEKVGSISYAWQAGSGDNRTRVFNAYTAKESGTLKGCGFFGFGDRFSSTYSDNTNSIDGFICNWAGPNNDQSMSTTANRAQKQCFEQNSDGKFVEILAKRAITYAPNNACNDTDAFVYDWPSHSGDGATNDLVDLTGDADYPNYSSPSAPTLSDGI